MTATPGRARLAAVPMGPTSCADEIQAEIGALVELEPPEAAACWLELGAVLLSIARQPREDRAERGPSRDGLVAETEVRR